MKYEIYFVGGLGDLYYTEGNSPLEALQNFYAIRDPATTIEIVEAGFNVVESDGFGGLCVLTPAE